MKQSTRCAAMLMMLVASSARANDAKKYPAFMCVEGGSTVSGTVNKSEYRITRTGGTPGTSALMLCPIVRDVFDNSSWGGPSIPAFASLKVDVLDTIDTADVSCTAVARDPGGGTYYYQTRSTAGVNSNPQVLTFPSSGNLWFASYYYIMCSLPTNTSAYDYAKIYSYQVDEVE